MPYYPFNFKPEFSFYQEQDQPDFGCDKENNEDEQQYRVRIYAANRALDLHDLEMQLFGETYDGEPWALRGRYVKNDLEQLKNDAKANVLANPEYDDEYPLNPFYNDCNSNFANEDDSEPLDDAWGYQRQYLEWDCPINELEFSTCDEYTAAMVWQQCPLHAQPIHAQ